MNRPLPARRYLAWSIASVLALSGGLFNARGADPETKPLHYWETNVLGTSLDLHVVAASPADGEKAHAAVMKEVERLRKILSTYDATTELGRVNATNEPVKVSKELLDVLQMYNDWQRKTPAFSGSLGKVSELWANAAKTGKTPSTEEVMTAVNMSKKPLWKLDAAAGTVQRMTGAAINIDSLGKGFIVSRAAAYAKASVPEVKGLLLDIGGDITAVGSRSLTKDEEWHIDVADPAHPGENAMPLTTLKLTGKSVATSGSYARPYVIGDKKYSHIIDPRSGYPTDNDDAPGGKHNPLIVSATVIAEDNAVANALATSLSVLMPDDGFALVGATPGAEALLVLSDGRRLRSTGFAKYETVSDLAGGKGWADGMEVSMAVDYNTVSRERPYVAIWVEDMKGNYITTLAQWGNNQRYVQDMQWSRFARQDPNLFRSVTRATRPAGKYTVVWDGRDQKGNPVSTGTYKVCVEFVYEHNGHTLNAGTIDCTEAGGKGVVGATKHFSEIPLAFGPKAK